jgi:hypothetical protein
MRSREGMLTIHDNSLPHDMMLASKMPGSRLICALGLPLVSCVPHTLAFTILGRGQVFWTFCMISVLRCQNRASTFTTPQNWGNLTYEWHENYLSILDSGPGDKGIGLTAQCRAQFREMPQ